MKRSLALLPLALLLASCSTPAEESAPVSDATAKESAETASTDVSEKLQDVAGNASVKATMEDGRVSIETDLVDPRGEDGSPEAKEAIKICEAATELDGVTYVNLYEADGTSWILYGHPMADDGECTEV